MTELPISSPSRPGTGAEPDHPVVDRDRGLIFFWTPRCGSTTLLIWFFHLIGWGDRLRSASAHQVRAEWVAEHGEVLEDRNLLFRDTGLRRIVVARDPYSRAVSSYYLSLTSRKEKQWAAVARDLADANEGRRLTWLEWLDFLDSQDLERCNIHWRLQSAKPWWALRLPVEIFRTEALNDHLTALGEELGTQPPLKRASASPRYEGTLDGVDIKTMTKPELEALLGHEERRHKLRFPPASAFLDADGIKRLTSLYERDLEALGYERRA